MGSICLRFEVLCGVSHSLSLRDMGVTGKERVWQGSGRFPPMEAKVGVLGGVLFSDLLPGPQKQGWLAELHGAEHPSPTAGEQESRGMLGKKTCVPNLPPGSPAFLPARLLPLMVPKSAVQLTQQGWGYRAGVAGGFGLVDRCGGVR